MHMCSQNSKYQQINAGNGCQTFAERGDPRSGGICHAINLVDGLNGLSIGLSLMMAGALATISMLVGDSAMTSVSLVLIAALAGIFAFNFPLGKIFLGDAGAYSIGHLLTWIAILLMARNPEVAPFAMFLIFFWPVADMLFAILRRLRNGKPIELEYLSGDVVRLGREHGVPTPIHRTLYAALKPIADQLEQG